MKKNKANIVDDIVYDVETTDVDGFDITDVTVALIDKHTNKKIGCIGMQCVYLYDKPEEVIYEADDFSGILSQEVDFLLQEKDVKALYKKPCYTVKGEHVRFYNYIGQIYQFDLEKKYQGKGFEQYAIENLGYIISQARPCMHVLAATFYIYANSDGNGDGNYMFEAEHNRKRGNTPSVSEDIVHTTKGMHEAEYKDGSYAYIIWNKNKAKMDTDLFNEPDVTMKDLNKLYSKYVSKQISI